MLTCRISPRSVLSLGIFVLNTWKIHGIVCQMAFHKSNAFACTYKTCSTGTILLCSYNEKQVVLTVTSTDFSHIGTICCFRVGSNVGDELYEKGADATKICTNCGQNIQCINKLCQPTVVPGEVENRKIWKKIGVYNNLQRPSHLYVLTTR